VADSVAQPNEQQAVDIALADNAPYRNLGAFVIADAEPNAARKMRGV
jgi:hypothetical protein